MTIFKVNDGVRIKAGAYNITDRHELAHFVRVI